MSQKPVALIPLLCVKCQAPIPARPDEVAWVCPQCGQGLVLDPTPEGKTAACVQEIFFSSAIAQGSPGRPYWVSSGMVNMTKRETYKGNESRKAQEFWSTAHLFYIPGWAASIEDIVSSGVQLIKTPIAMQSGSPTPFLPVVTLPADMKALAEFMVMSIEAARHDMLKRLEFDLTLAPPQLWILP
jgi:hypothetical protein